MLTHGGVLASKLVDCEVYYFKHNDSQDLERILSTITYQRAIVAVEGIYSMEGDLLDREIFTVADKYGALLIIDEAHSAGVIGKHLLGIFDYYDITPNSNHIKMGTLGKAMGSYGAYILANEEIISFLQNRAKAIIYATAPSIFDIALAMCSMKKIQEDRKLFSYAIQERYDLVKEVLDISLQSPILKIEVESSAVAIALKEFALDEGYLIGAIRPPTVDKAMLRIILRTNISLEKIQNLLMKLKEKNV